MMIMAMMAGVLAASPARVAPKTSLPECKAQLSLGFDSENGDFDGMSHSGVLLVLRNLGSACRTAGLPVLRFENAAGAPLPIARAAPVGMHPGPVVVPVGLASGAEATAPLRWVSGDVYDGHNCITPARIVVITGVNRFAQPWPAGQLCGAAGKPIPFDQPLLRTDPVLKP